ncbi:MAG: DUF3102 domain-containing protein [Oscillospiraceae bacterium]|nr:DUF3102 domain-containing protein [Oscillospiraceae bacterium]
MSNIIEAGRSLEQVTNGIRILTAQTAANMCQLGKLLTEAKAMVGHGGWKEYLEKEVSYSQSTANNFMRLYEAYGEFGPNPQTFGNLGASKALELLALPEGQREEFAEAHDVESMSVRELKAQIAAEKERAEKAETDTAALREQLAVAQEEIGAAHQKAADWQKQARDWQDKNSEDKRVERKLRADVTALETELAAARAQAGKVSPSEMVEIEDQARREAERIVADSHRDELAAKDATIERLEAELQQAQEAAEQGDEQQTLLSLAGQAASDVGSALNVLCGYYKKFKPRYPRIADAIRNLAVKQIETIQKGFDIEPV